MPWPKWGKKKATADSGGTAPPPVDAALLQRLPAHWADEDDLAQRATWLMLRSGREDALNEVDRLTAAHAASHPAFAIDALSTMLQLPQDRVVDGLCAAAAAGHQGTGVASAVVPAPAPTPQAGLGSTTSHRGNPWAAARQAAREHNENQATAATSSIPRGAAPLGELPNGSASREERPGHHHHPQQPRLGPVEDPCDTCGFRQGPAGPSPVPVVPVGAQEHWRHWHRDELVHSHGRSRRDPDLPSVGTSSAAGTATPPSHPLQSVATVAADGLHPREEAAGSSTGAAAGSARARALDPTRDPLDSFVRRGRQEHGHGPFDAGETEPDTAPPLLPAYRVSGCDFAVPQAWSLAARARRSRSRSPSLQPQAGGPTSVWAAAQRATSRDDGLVRTPSASPRSYSHDDDEGGGGGDVDASMPRSLAYPDESDGRPLPVGTVIRVLPPRFTTSSSTDRDHHHGDGVRDTALMTVERAPIWDIAAQRRSRAAVALSALEEEEVTSRASLYALCAVRFDDITTRAQDDREEVKLRLSAQASFGGGAVGLGRLFGSASRGDDTPPPAPAAAYSTMTPSRENSLTASPVGPEPGSAASWRQRHGDSYAHHGSDHQGMGEHHSTHRHHHPHEMQALEAPTGGRGSRSASLPPATTTTHAQQHDVVSPPPALCQQHDELTESVNREARKALFASPPRGEAPQAITPGSTETAKKRPPPLQTPAKDQPSPAHRVSPPHDGNQDGSEPARGEADDDTEAPARPMSPRHKPIRPEQLPPTTSHAADLLAQIDLSAVDIQKDYAVAALGDKLWSPIVERDDAVEHLSAGNGFFCFCCKGGDHLTRDAVRHIAAIVNLSQFADELVENNVPHVSTCDAAEMKGYKFIVVKAMYGLPGVDDPSKLTAKLLSSVEYHEQCQPGPPKLEQPDPHGHPNTVRFHKAIIRFVYTITVQLSVSVITDPAVLDHLAVVVGVRPVHAILMERTKRDKAKKDSTVKCKSILLYYRVRGGLLCTNVSVVVNTSIPGIAASIVNRFGSSGADEVKDTMHKTRRYLAKALAAPAAPTRIKGKGTGAARFGK